MRNMLIAFSIVVTAVGCGGKKGGDSTTPTGGGDTEATTSSPQDNSSQMVPPEKMDEIVHLLDRKQGIVSRCLAIAVDNKELPKNSHGKVTLEMTITPGGKAEDIKVIKSTLESKSLSECVIGHVRTIQFPELPKPYPTSYTYAFEAM